jgi:hypothetical protein
MNNKKDCFAYSDGKCNILTKMLCKNGKCRFGKTKQQFRRDIIKSKKRIDSLPPIKKQAIKEKYPVFNYISNSLSEWR